MFYRASIDFQTEICLTYNRLAIFTFTITANSLYLCGHLKQNDNQQNHFYCQNVCLLAICFGWAELNFLLRFELLLNTPHPRIHYLNLKLKNQKIGFLSFPSDPTRLNKSAPKYIYEIKGR